MIIEELGHLSLDERAQHTWIRGMKEAPLYERLADLQRDADDTDLDLIKEVAYERGYKVGYEAATNRDYQAEINKLTVELEVLRARLKVAGSDLEQARAFILSDDVRKIDNRKKYAQLIRSLVIAWYR